MRLSRLTLALVALSLALIVAGCGSSSVAPAPPAPTAAAAPDEQPGDESIATDAQAEATSVTAAAGDTLYIANTGGNGVSVRTECADSFRRAGTMSEGFAVEVVRDATGTSCEGWTLVWGSGSGATWVRERYLETVPPSAETTATEAKVILATVSVISYKDYWVPVSELRVQKAWSADLTTNYGATYRVGCLQDHWRAVRDTVITYGGAVIRDPAPSGCGFGALEDVDRLEVPAS